MKHRAVVTVVTSVKSEEQEEATRWVGLNLDVVKHRDAMIAAALVKATEQVEAAG